MLSEPRPELKKRLEAALVLEDETRVWFPPDLHERDSEPGHESGRMLKRGFSVG